VRSGRVTLPVEISSFGVFTQPGSVADVHDSPRDFTPATCYAGTAVHYRPTVDGMDQSTAVGFQWLTRMRNLIFLLMCLTGLSGCYVQTPPIRSATVVYDNVYSALSPLIETDGARQSSTLSASQIYALDQWLYSHQLNWSLLVSSPPRPSISITLFHDNGTRSALDFILRWYGGKPVKLLVLWRQDDTGKSLGGVIRQLSNEDLSLLEHFLLSKR
jgi:hypothetical protein